MIKDLEALIAENQLEIVDIGRDEASANLAAAFLHLKSAKQIMDWDPVGSFQLSYDAARKALQAVLALNGFRVRKPPRGNHFTFVRVSRAGLVTPEIWRPLDWMREMRNSSEYSVFENEVADTEDARQGLEAAEQMVLDARQHLTINHA